MERNTYVCLENSDNKKVIEDKFRNTTLKKAISEGIESGIALDFDSEKHLELLKTKKNQDLTSFKTCQF